MFKKKPEGLCHLHYLTEESINNLWKGLRFPSFYLEIHLFPFFPPISLFVSGAVDTNLIG